MIHVIGNSHAHYFSESTAITDAECHKYNPYFRSYSIGAVIAYNFYEHHLNTVKNLIANRINPTENDYVMLVVGEVDCRWHLPKRASDIGQDVNVVVNECVDRYFRAIKELNDSGVKMVVFGAHPSTTGGHNDDFNNPVFGDCLFRNRISIQYNKRLEEKCLTENIPFVNIFDYLVDSETGLTKMEFFRDYCHLNFTSHPYMVEQFKNKGLIK